MNGKMITPEIMRKIWNLHASKVDADVIAETLEVSKISVQRFIKIMTAVQNGDDADAVGRGHQKQIDFAKKFFGIEEKKEEKREEPKQFECLTAADDISKEFMQRVVLLLSYQTSLLEQLCAEFGVNVKILNEVKKDDDKTRT